MKPATIADAPAVLNTNDKAMWALGFNAAIEAAAKSPDAPGISALAYVIERLLVDGECRDEEGETTQQLVQLLTALRVSAHGVKGGQTPDPLTLQNAPLLTRAPAIGGGAWCRVEHGWKWNGPHGGGGTFPRPGGDWNGNLVTAEAWNAIHSRGVAVREVPSLTDEQIEQLANEAGVIYPCRVSRLQAINFARAVLNAAGVSVVDGQTFSPPDADGSTRA